MYVKFDWEIYKKICEVTGTDYEAIGEFVPAENFESMINDLLHEIDIKKEQIEDLEKDIEENYTLIKPAKEYGE